MNKYISFPLVGSIALMVMGMFSCTAPAILQTPAGKPLPAAFTSGKDTLNIATIRWNTFFTDPTLISLIDTALANNFDLKITLQDIEIAKNGIRMAQSKLMPTVSAGAGLGIEKVGRYTSQGAGDASADITPGKGVPEILPSQLLGFQASWEMDIWGKLKTARKAALTRYLSSQEAKNWVTTNLVAEIANNYYELLASLNQLEIIRQAIQLQQKELDVVKIQRQAAAVTELAVKQFEAQLLNAKALEYNELQQILVFENNINLLIGKYPGTSRWEASRFMQPLPITIQAGLPAQLLENRPDIRKAELDVMATKFDVQVARAEFFPSLNLGASLGYNAFSPKYLLHTPESIFFSLAGELVGPLINKNAIIAEFNTANAAQIQAVYNYQKTVLNGFLEVTNQMGAIQNMQQAYQLKTKEVETLASSIEIASDLFKASRANYLEVLVAQRDALETRLEWVEAKKMQWNALTNLFKACGGGWK
ncbi:MAG: efflux transporter outer membrane subunit [Chitinophagia bacterium]|jgi:NodT family efflux transporter outer membrane factor (OMF) lipoprotein